MKTTLFCLLASLIGVTQAQDQTYSKATDSFNHKVIVYSDVAVGDVAVEIVTISPDTPDSPLSIISYTNAGLEGNETLNLVRTNNDYLMGSEESVNVTVSINEPVSFGGILGRPFYIDLAFEAGEGNRLQITLENSDEFELSSE